MTKVVFGVAVLVASGVLLGTQGLRVIRFLRRELAAEIPILSLGKAWAQKQ